MRVFTKSGLLTAAAAVCVTAASAASAAVVDFTASNSTSGSVGSIGWSLTGSPGDTIIFGDNGPGSVGVLAGLNDGVGLNDDEISEGGQYLTVVFDRPVRLTGFWALDLFRDGARDTDPETAQVYAGSTPTGAPLASLAATEVKIIGTPGVGFGFLGGLNFVGTTFTFNELDGGNDGAGVGDYALAGLEIAAIPVPAGGLMFGTALLGLGLLRRRG